MTASHQLRTRTAACHEAVDAAFGGFDLQNRSDYAALLHAHARALVPAEVALHGWPALPSWRPRTSVLASDLIELGDDLPAPLAFALADEASAWGALYVLEGSRLGNAFLARQVGAGLPTGYMGARHGQGDWRALLSAIDAQGSRGGEPWLELATRGARATFALYLTAAARGRSN